MSNEKDWCEKSLLLRQAHECTHYLTKQTYGISNNILHDEIMADFIGMYEAFGFYKAEWFQRQQAYLLHKRPARKCAQGRFRACGTVG